MSYIEYLKYTVFTDYVFLRSSTLLKASVSIQRFSNAFGTPKILKPLYSNLHLNEVLTESLFASASLLLFHWFDDLLCNAEYCFMI